MAKTLVLWVGPFLLLLGGLWATWSFYRRRAQAPAAAPPLSADEKRRLDTLLEDGK
jgi:cytochrome c-type biogenesis protein CcmH